MAAIAVPASTATAARRRLESSRKRATNAVKRAASHDVNVDAAAADARAQEGGPKPSRIRCQSSVSAVIGASPRACGSVIAPKLTNIGVAKATSRPTPAEPAGSPQAANTSTNNTKTTIDDTTAGNRAATSGEFSARRAAASSKYTSGGWCA